MSAGGVIAQRGPLTPDRIATPREESLFVGVGFLLAKPMRANCIRE